MRSLPVAAGLLVALAPVVALAVPTEFNYVGSAQAFAVPTTGFYTISADGAAGGKGFDGAVGGGGAFVEGVFTLTEGEVLTILVGGEGEAGADGPGGGGGGTFILGPGGAPLLIAGGGGGGGFDGYNTNNGGGGTGLGGNGDGGAGGSTNNNGGGNGGGGGGLLTDGDHGAGPDENGSGGKSVSNGAAGGAGSLAAGSGGYGGGGGGGTLGGGGGGGGYSGGGGGTSPDPGAGGTSFDVGVDVVVTPGHNLAANGDVIIAPDFPAAVLPEPASLPLAGAGLLAFGLIGWGRRRTP